MCGLIGYYCFGDKRPSKERFANMLVECSSRGTDATGLAYIKDGTLRILKKGITSFKFIQSKAFKELELPKILMGHTRNGTGGHAGNNKNNHPLYSKMGLAIAHNGVIRNDETIFRKKKYKRDGQVDSEVILRAIEEKLHEGLETAIKNTSIIMGSFAVSAVYQKEPDTLALFAHNNPIVLFYDKADDILYYASTFPIIQAGFSERVRGFNFSSLPEPLTYELLEDEAMLIGKDGLMASYNFYDDTKNISIMVSGTWDYTRNHHYKGGSKPEEEETIMYNRGEKTHICSECNRAVSEWSLAYDIQDHKVCRACAFGAELGQLPIGGIR